METGPYETSTIRSKHDTPKNSSQSRSSNRSNMQHETIFKMNPPKYSISGLKRGMITPRDLTENKTGTKLKNEQYLNVKKEGNGPDSNKTVC